MQASVDEPLELVSGQRVVRCATAPTPAITTTPAGTTCLRRRRSRNTELRRLLPLTVLPRHHLRMPQASWGAVCSVQAELRAVRKRATT